jgi:tetratricopeptide (TPR) repeat protein
MEEPMFKRVRGWWLLAALALIGADPGRDARALVRQGNAAFAEGEYEEAARLYQQAEERITDPGLAAFNKATALAEQGKYADAVRHYWLCLGDAGTRIERLLRQHPERDLPVPVRRSAGPRLARALYNLGNCVLQQSGGTDADLLEQAIALFDHCLRPGRAADALRADARHNLELARELLRLHPRPPKRDQSSSDQRDQDKSTGKDDRGEDQGDNGEGTDPQGGAVKPDPNQRDDSADRSLETDETMAGRGNLATLPDKDELVPMSAEDAAAHLRQAVQRILGERRSYQEKAARSSSRDVLDW